MPDAQPPPDSPPGPISRTVMQRILTSLVLLPIVAAGLTLGGWAWAGLCLLLFGLALLEFNGLARRMADTRGAYLRVMALGVLYTGTAPLILALLREQPAGPFWLLVLFGITMGTDTLAYAGGRAFGRRPLAARLSPGKTVEGTLSGMLGGALIALAFLQGGSALSLSTGLMALTAPAAAIGGDLLESGIKRRAHAKDSHLDHLDMLPGHGGVLDRADSLLLTAPYVAAWLLAAGLL